MIRSATSCRGFCTKPWGMDFGGWIVINKSSGEVAIVEAYDWTGEDKHLVPV